jgi:peroxiredoxin (alkyl hydroperoxide reductase subunit C)
MKRLLLGLLVVPGFLLYAESRVLVGQKAPNFTAPAVIAGEQESISLSKYTDKYKILAFYPSDFSFVCPTELRELQKLSAEFEKRNAVILAISVDQIYTHVAWLETPQDKGGVKGITFPLISDTSHQIACSYGVLTPDGVAMRALFVLDRDDIVQAALINNKAIGRNMKEALRLLDALQESEKHGEVCPASWHKGEKTIKPTRKGMTQYLEKK